MNSPLSLKEYRCACGKLLFKGLMLISVVEIKCKRCGATKTFRDDTRGIRLFMLVVDCDGRIVDACDGVAAIEQSREYVIGKLLSDTLPLLRDTHYEEIAKIEPTSDNSYQIKNNTLLLRDCQVPLESHIVPVKSKGKQLYRVFNIMKKA